MLHRRGHQLLGRGAGLDDAQAVQLGAGTRMPVSAMRRSREWLNRRMAWRQPPSRPTSTSGRPSDAFSEAIRMSLDAAIARPEPSAAPLIAHDHRLGALADRVEAFARAARVRGQVARALDDLGAALQVGAGAEHLAGAGQHHDAHLVHLGDAVERQRQFVVERARQRVDRRRC